MLDLPSNPRLIIICGNPHAGDSPKYDRIFSQDVTFGYRDYARVAGALIFPFSISGELRSYEAAVNDPDAIAEYCNAWPDAVVWSLKAWTPEKVALLQRIKNRKVHYSCGARNTFNPHCDVSLVDDPIRVSNKHMRLWIKGKDPQQWPLLSDTRVYDYLVLGRNKPGKNQKLFYSMIFDSVASPRSVLWVGGSDVEEEIPAGIHKLHLVPFAKSVDLPSYFAKCKVGGLFTEWHDEGFPQSYLEMAMCGLPVVYNAAAPWSTSYESPAISCRVTRKNLVEQAEHLRNNADHAKCRAAAVAQFSLERSIASIIEAANSI